jgi:hypothetical protein
LTVASAVGWEQARRAALRQLAEHLVDAKGEVWNGQRRDAVAATVGSAVGICIAGRFAIDLHPAGVALRSANEPVLRYLAVTEDTATVVTVTRLHLASFRFVPEVLDSEIIRHPALRDRRWLVYHVESNR